MKKTVFLLSALLALCTCKKSDDTPHINSLNTEFNHKILDNYFVLEIAFDHKGNAWIGTFKQGLIKYNSEGTTVYNLSNSIFPDTSVIYDIAVDSKDNIWISCEGLFKFNGSSFEHYHSENTDIPVNYIGSIAVDSKDNIWFTSYTYVKGGIVKYDGHTWTVYTPENSDLLVNEVNDIAIDKNDNVWMALRSNNLNVHLVKISNDNWISYTSSDLGFTPLHISKIRVNSNNKICGAIDYSIIADIVNPGPQVFIFDGENTEQLQFDSIADIKSLMVDKNDNIWCICHGGFDGNHEYMVLRGYVVYDGNNWWINDTSFYNIEIFAIEQSPDNYIWIGTKDGVYINDITINN